MELVEHARAALCARAVAADAEPMARYMKAPPGSFLGVKQPARKEILRQLKPQMPRARGAAQAVIEALWAGPYREERYLAIELLLTCRPLLTVDGLPLLERMIREGAWWDLVDPLATRGVGHIWQRERAATAPEMDRWIQDGCLWIRRAALLGQLKHKQHTDQQRLFGYCRATMHETAFFVAKAIGWALREHAKTAPDAVQAFLVAEWARLQPLSRREASRRMVAAGWAPPPMAPRG